MKNIFEMEYTDRDWEEDKQFENGNYECVCLKCNKTFTGHKHRMFCKICSNKINKDEL